MKHLIKILGRAVKEIYFARRGYIVAWIRGGAQVGVDARDFFHSTKPNVAELIFVAASPYSKTPLALTSCAPTIQNLTHAAVPSMREAPAPISCDCPIGI